MSTYQERLEIRAHPAPDDDAARIFGLPILEIVAIREWPDPVTGPPVGRATFTKQERCNAAMANGSCQHVATLYGVTAAQIAAWRREFGVRPRR